MMNAPFTIRLSGPITDVHPDLFTAAQQRDVAIARQDAANGEEFGQRARVFILHRLRIFGPASGEELVICCKEAGITPKGDDRAFGGAFLSLSKKGLIVKVGECKRKRGHATAGGIVWAFVQ